MWYFLISAVYIVFVSAMTFFAHQYPQCEPSMCATEHSISVLVLLCTPLVIGYLWGKSK